MLLKQKYQTTTWATMFMDNRKLTMLDSISDATVTIWQLYILF